MLLLAVGAAAALLYCCCRYKRRHEVRVIREHVRELDDIVSEHEGGGG